MKRIVHLLVMLCVVLSCTKEDVKNRVDCDCNSLFASEGLSLFKFQPFTTEQWKTLSYDDKVSLRQLPNDFLKQMNNCELFVQFVQLDMAKDILLFNTPQEGIVAALNRFNILQELFIRNKVDTFFIKAMAEIDLKTIKNNDYHFYFLCLQMLSVQPQIVNKMNKDNTLHFVNILYKINEDMSQLSYSDSSWSYIQNYYACMIGFGNIMKKYNYIPFNDLLNSNNDVNKFMNGYLPLNEDVFLLINNQMLEFYKQLNV